MFTDSPVRETSINSAIRRRGVGKAIWKQMIEELIASEKADLKDLAVLRRLLSSSNEGLRVIADLHARKTVRVDELNELLRYSDRDTNRRIDT